MKNILLAFTFIIAIASAFAFKSNSGAVKPAVFDDITLYKNITSCPSEICNPNNLGAVCTDLFTTPVTCVGAYVGSARHLN